ncbi:TIGR02391 family protein [Rhodococcus aetherivorans]
MIANTTITVERTLADGTTTSHTTKALVDSNEVSVPLGTDIRSGDFVVHVLSNKDEQRYRVIDVHEMRSPFGAGLDYIKLECEKLGRAARVVPQPVSIPELHPLVSSAAGALFADGYVDKAVFEAFRAVEHRMQILAGRTEVGQSLAGQVIPSPIDPSCATMTDRNRDEERAGFKLVFMGAFAGIRNPRGHGAIATPTDEIEAREMLTLASLLMRRLDRAEKAINGPQT